MWGANLNFNRSESDDGFYIPVKGRRNQNEKKPQLLRTQSDTVNGGLGVANTSRDASPWKFPFSNVERFLQAITPSVSAEYLSKTTMRGWKTCDVEYEPYFMLSEVWESFKEWSAYGVGVPLVLNGNDSVVQYYGPSLSAIQIYVDPTKYSVKSRRRSEDSDGDFFSRDSSSDGSSDSERDRVLAYSRTKMQEGSSSDEGELPQGGLLFQYLEHDPPYARGPFADRIAELAFHFPELKTLRSCDVLPSSWFSVAWYPIYRIPMGPTLKDLEACFLTYHSLHTPVGDVATAQAPPVIYPSEIDGRPRISLPVFGLASYKFRGSLWTSNNGSDQQLVSSLSEAADRWLRSLQVNHPDYLFFSRNR